MIGQKIKELRENHGLSQLDLAKILNIAQSSVGNYEREERLPDADIICKLADHFQISTDYLLGRREERFVETGLSDEAYNNLLACGRDMMQLELDWLISHSKFTELIGYFSKYVLAYDIYTGVDMAATLRDDLSKMKQDDPLYEYKRTLLTSLEQTNTNEYWLYITKETLGNMAKEIREDYLEFLSQTK